MITESTTIEFDSDLLDVLRLQAEGSGNSISDLVNDAVRLAIEMREDAEDRAAIEAAKGESSRSFEEFVEEMRSRGEL